MNYRLPIWFRQELPDSISFSRLAEFNRYQVNTVCREAKCPNIFECFKDSQMTFMILGDTCTRNCRFCAVQKKSHNQSLGIDFKEPERILEIVRKLNLKYVVITSVTRDDLVDGGSSVFAGVLDTIHKFNKNIKIEVLIPDFQGDISSIRCVIKAGPDVAGHNIETIERLYRDLRPQGEYRRSLEVLKKIKELCFELITKSSIMLGLGEKDFEVRQAMQDLREASCDIVTLGQYLAPTITHYPVKEFITPKKFLEYKEYALALGFKAVLSGPLVRSSYKAESVFKEFHYA